MLQASTKLVTLVGVGIPLDKPQAAHNADKSHACTAHSTARDYQCVCWQRTQASCSVLVRELANSCCWLAHKLSGPPVDFVTRTNTTQLSCTPEARCLAAAADDHRPGPTCHPKTRADEN
jgi:hypothetical protein